MTTKKPKATSRGQVKKLKLKKETIKDLDARKKAGGVKGGWVKTASTLKYEHTCRSCAVCIVGIG